MTFIFYDEIWNQNGFGLFISILFYLDQYNLLINKKFSLQHR